MDKIQEAIAKYICVLSDSLNRTTSANDRPAYTKHLAEAARWIGMIYRGCSLEELKESILAEKRAYGWGYLLEAEGEAAEKAFNELADFVTGL